MTGRARAVLARPEHCALFIDIDGTLINVAPTPDAVLVPTGLVPLLERTSAGLGGAVAILTGRSVADADRLLAPLKLVAAGVHGVELRAKRGGDVAQMAPAIPPDVVQAIGSICQLAHGILIEEKGAGIAVHYRNAPLAKMALESDLARIITECSYDLVVRQGRKVLEAVPSGFTKGSALAALVGMAPFKGRRPIMIGDDVGDEAALRAAEQLGGVGLKVAGEHFSRAEADFESVASVLEWLSEFADRLAVENATSMA